MFISYLLSIIDIPDRKLTAIIIFPNTMSKIYEYSVPRR